MDEYLETAETEEQYRIWMQILPLYRFVTNLEDYVELVMKSDMLETLDDLRSPGQSQALQGSGISVPELDATLGIGINFIIRELIRHDVLEPEDCQQYGFVLPKQVRIAFSKLQDCLINKNKADPNQSELIYDYVEQFLGEDKASFEKCFDIPFRVLLMEPDLCEELLGIGLWSETDDE